MKWKFIISLVVIVVMLYLLNEWTENKLLDFAQKFPKLIAIGIAMIAIIFPRDWDKVPGYLKKYSGKCMRGGKKRNVSENVKKYIASQQNWKCQLCQNQLDATYEVDHIIPLYQGGTNDYENLQALCRNCHGKKTLSDRIF